MKSLLLLFLIFPFMAFSQIKMYTGTHKFSSDIIYSIENNTVYRYNNVASRLDVLYLQGNIVYLKDRKFFQDVKYTLHNNCIYKGNSTSTFDLLFTLKDGRLYVGSNIFSNNCLYSFKDGIVYRGDSSSTFDAFMSYEATNENELLFVAMLILPY